MDDESYLSLYNDYMNGEIITIGIQLYGEQFHRDLLISIGLKWMQTMDIDKLYNLLRRVPEDPFGDPAILLRMLGCLRTESTKSVLKAMEEVGIPTQVIRQAGNP